MTSVWVAEHGWVYLMATIDCCTRENVERAVAERGITPGSLTLGTDNGGVHRPRVEGLLVGRGIAHSRGGYRDPESQAFIESWFGRSRNAASGGTSSRPSTRSAR